MPRTARRRSNRSPWATSMVLQPLAVALGRAKGDRSLPKSESGVDGVDPGKGRDHPGHRRASVLGGRWSGFGRSAFARADRQLRSGRAAARPLGPGRRPQGGDKILRRDGVVSAAGFGRGGRDGGSRLQFPGLRVGELCRVGTCGILVHNTNEGTPTVPNNPPSRYSGRYADGEKAYRTNVPRDANNTPLPDPGATGPHTRLQPDAVNPGRAYSGTEFDANGVPVKRVDMAGRPGETLPHQHTYDPKTRALGPKEPLE